MNQYETFMRHVYTTGVNKTDRTGTGTRSVFGYQMRFDLSKGFPLVTTKKLHTRSIFVELLWFLRGDSNVRWLQENGCTIWDEWAREDGDLGPVYGVQWRSWPTPDGGHIDQISQILDQIRKTPDSRRLIVSAWNVGEIKNMALPPCHAFFQFYVAEGKLSCQLYQRSADIFLGVPFNIASYALLTHMVAQQCGLEVGDFVWTGETVTSTVITSSKSNSSFRANRIPIQDSSYSANPTLSLIIVTKISSSKIMPITRTSKHRWRFNKGLQAHAALFDRRLCTKPCHWAR